MPGAAKILLFILCLPFFASLGHDIYLNYFSDDEKIQQAKNLQVDPTDFMFSDLGWVWQTYSPFTMETAKDMVGEDKWKKKYDPILQQSTMVVTAVPPILGLIFLAITFVFGIWPFSRFGAERARDKKGYGAYDRAKTRTTKYGRK